MLAAYNAGPGRVRGWWRAAMADKQFRTDVFVEEIPYRETHGYVKSVLASYGVYRYLYGDRHDASNRTIPRLPARLPTRLDHFTHPHRNIRNPALFEGTHMYEICLRTLRGSCCAAIR